LLAGYRRDFKPELYPFKHGQEDQARVQRDPYDVGSPTPPLTYSLLSLGEFSLAYRCNGSLHRVELACHLTAARDLVSDLTASELMRRFWRVRMVKNDNFIQKGSCKSH